MRPSTLTLPEAMEQAGSAYNSGAWAQAEQLCRSILRAKPDYFDALNLLGVIAAQTLHTEEAADLLGRAVAAKPRDAEAHANYANVLMQLKRFDDALASYERALKIKPDHADTHYNLGNALQELERHEDAVNNYGDALRIKPDHAEAYYGRGNSLQALERFADALESYERALRIKPDYVDAYYNRGNALHALKRFDDAVQSYERALRLAPDYVEAYFNRGNALQELKRFDDAADSYRRALAIRPDYAEACLNLAKSLQELRRFDEALDGYERALMVRSDFAEAYNNRGNTLKDLERFEESLESYERALKIRPDYAEAYINRGNLLRELNQVDAALESYDRAIAIRADFADAHLNRSVALLLSGDYVNGWLGNEWRWKLTGAGDIFDKRHFSQALWLGEEPLTGKTILLHSEQGLGDTLQFCRYAKLVAALGARVILEVEKPLQSLLTSLDGVAQVAVKGETLPAFEYHCPLLSLPLAFKTTLSTVPSQVPYVKSSAEKVRYWKEKLGERRKPRVGLVWSGGFRPNLPKYWPVNARRNIPLAKLAGLKHPDIEFYSLQKGQPAESELDALVSRNWNGPHLIDHTPLLHDFSDTAALIEQLDLVISVDTSTAHLAGALGKPTWILNRFDTCWRWLLHRIDSPWYPTLRLYRQETAGIWDGVVHRVGEDLMKLANDAF
jgi:tetratricopeptide (TPR) repeat protein